MKNATFAAQHTIIAHEDEGLDHYARRGVVLSRDAGHRAIKALREDAYGMRKRGGEANLAAADEADALAWNIGHALANS